MYTFVSFVQIKYTTMLSVGISLLYISLLEMYKNFLYYEIRLLLDLAVALTKQNLNEKRKLVFCITHNIHFSYKKMQILFNIFFRI